MRLTSENDDADSVYARRIGRLGRGAVLVAQEDLTDPNFDATMVLVCVCGADGAYGLVLNRPSHMPISEMFDGFSGLNASKKIHIGGPVQQETLQILHVTDSPALQAYQITPRVYMGGQWQDLASILDSDGNDLRLFLGYSGWAPGQLENEIRLGAWEVYSVDTEVLLTGPEDEWFAGLERIDRYLKSITASPQ